MLRNHKRLVGIRHRIELLEELIGDVKEDHGSLLYAERNLGIPWQAILAQVDSAQKGRKDNQMLEAVKAGLVHLESKEQLVFSNGNQAFSQAAMQMDALSGAPVIGSLFSSSASFFRNEGIRKQINRLDVIEGWVRELDI